MWFKSYKLFRQNSSKDLNKNYKKPRTNGGGYNILTVAVTNDNKTVFLDMCHC